MNNGFESVVRHLVAMSLSAMWHLGCVSVKRKDGGDLLCTVTTLGVVGSVLSLNGRMVQQYKRTFAHARDVSWSRLFDS